MGLLVELGVSFIECGAPGTIVITLVCVIPLDTTLTVTVPILIPVNFPSVLIVAVPVPSVFDHINTAPVMTFPQTS